ncbi:MAG: ABC transporter substrate-binding protein [Saprospiraceae bacterium]|nr:ABC transporter substrate-binding protein [Saprospiraceae bacterium]MDW8228716.1 ABC transporter substrate-binding protein [Saprospiraceae bacterium]
MTFCCARRLLLPAFLGLLAAAMLVTCGDDRTARCGKISFKTDNTVTVRMEAAATSLNPILPGPGYNRYVAANLFQSLAAVEPKTLELVPLLIEKIPTVYTVKDGPRAGMLAYDFKIYDEAAWDNGSPITGHDVLFSLKILHHPLLPLGEWLGYFERLKALEVDAQNPKKFTAYFDQFYILGLESLCQFPIYPAYQYDPEGVLASVSLADLQDRTRAQQLAAGGDANSSKVSGKTGSKAGDATTNESKNKFAAWAEAFQSPRFANDKTAISGSGPYRLENFDVDQGIVLIKKSNWWGDRVASRNRYLAAYPEKIIYRFIKEEAAAENLIRSGDVDIVPALSPTKFLELKQDTCLPLRYDMALVSANAYARVLCNTTRPALADKRVRQALAHALDYDYMLHTIWEGMAERCISPVHPAKPFYARSLKPYAYDISKARQLLADAGWTDTDGDGIADKMLNGQRVKLELSLLTAGASPTSSATAKSIQNTARAAGFALNVVEDDIRVIAQKTRQGDYDLALTSVVLFPGLWDPYQSFHSKSIGSGNRSAFANAELDRLIEALRAEADEKKRNDLYLRIQQLLHDELPEIFLYAPQQRFAVSRRFDYVLSANRPGYYEAYFKLKN